MSGMKWFYCLFPSKKLNQRRVRWPLIPPVIKDQSGVLLESSTFFHFPPFILGK